MTPEARIHAGVAERLALVAQLTRNGRRMLAVCEAAPELLAELDALEERATRVGVAVAAAATSLSQNP